MSTNAKNAKDLAQETLGAIVSTGITVSREIVEKVYQVIESTGKTKLRVGYISDSMPALKDGEEMFNSDGVLLEKRIINFKAFPASKVPKVLEIFKDKNEIDISELNGLNLTATAFAGMPIPMKGELIDCQIEYAEDREGNPVLTVQAYSVPDAKVAKSFSFSDDFETAE